MACPLAQICPIQGSCVDLDQHLARPSEGFWVVSIVHDLWATWLVCLDCLHLLSLLCYHAAVRLRRSNFFCKSLTARCSASIPGTALSVVTCKNIVKAWLQAAVWLYQHQTRMHVLGKTLELGDLLPACTRQMASVETFVIGYLL